LDVVVCKKWALGAKHTLTQINVPSDLFRDAS
jgi:hypothetical protein